MARGERWVGGLLVAGGWIGMLAGLIVALYFALVLAPKAGQLTARAADDMRSVDRQLVSLSESPAWSSWEGITRRSTELAALMPNLLLTSKGSLLQTAAVLDSSAQAAKKTTEGVAGIVAPKEAVRHDATSLEKSAAQLRLMANTVEQARALSFGLAGDLSRFSSGLGPGQILPVLQQSHARLQTAVGWLDGLRLPFWVALLGIAAGGLCFLLGLSALSIGLIHRRTLLLLARAEGTAAPARRAA